MTKLCPFRTKTIYTSGRNTGAGYPDVWIENTEFCECDQDRCMMWVPFNKTDRHALGEDGWCRMGK